MVCDCLLIRDKVKVSVCFFGNETGQRGPSLEVLF